MAFGAVFELSSLNGTNGFQISGAAVSDRSGWSVATAGDINGDGYSDVIIGSSEAAGGSGESTVYVLFGKASGFAGEFNLSALNGSNGFRVNWQSSGDELGFSVASAGDVNDDGYDDFIIGAKGADPNGSSSGASYVVFGKATAFATDLSVSTLGGANGFKISGEAAYDLSGWSVASAGDVNGDGFDDVIVGAYQADPNGSNSGAAYVIFGKAAGFAANLNLSALSGADGFQISGEFNGDNAGISVASAGDINQDGFDDLIVGAFRADPVGSTSGASYLVFGKASGFSANLNLSALDGTNGFQINGEAASNGSGRSVSSAGDFNGDGFADLLIGAYNVAANGASSGASYVVFGKPAGFAANLNLSSLDGTNGFQISGEGTFDFSGKSVSSAGDFNGDGYDDLVIGAYYDNPRGTGSGSTYIVFGRASGFSANLNLSTLDGATGFQINGEAANDFSGWSVAGAGDVNGDGYDDVIIGAQGADPGGNLSGASYIVFGGPTASNFTGTNADETFTGDATADTISGGGGKDSLSGAGGDDDLNGGDGNDVVDGGDGADDIVGGTGNDLLIGGAGDDVITDASGSNKLNGGAGDDTLTGATGADRINGEGDNDTLIGGAGNDYLDGGAGTNSLTGGTGNDVFIVRTLNDTVIEAAGEGTDTIRSMISYSLAEGSNIEVLELLTGLGLSATGNSDANTLRGNGGGNTLSGLAGADRLEGGDGADVLIGGLGRDQLYGNLGTGAGDGDVDTFRVLQESVGLSPLEIDTVHDYEVGVDILDFSLLDADTRALPAAAGDQDFTLTTTGFTRTAGELFVFYTASGDVTTVRLDVDGDGKADYQMAIKGDVSNDTAGWLL